jgi:uncharacterized membrane protein YkoI
MNPVRKIVITAGIAAVGLLGVGVGATSLGTASAASATPPTTVASSDATASSTTADSAATDPAAKGGPHEANGITETELTGDDLAKATAAAQTAVPDGTVVRAETDADGATYEVHMTSADGSKITVKLDANFAVTSTVDGNG